MWVQPAPKTSSKDWQRVRRWERGHSSALLPGKVGNPRVQHSLACTRWLQSIGSLRLSKSCFPCYSAECWGYLKMGQPNFNFQLSMSRSVLEDGAPRAGWGKAAVCKSSIWGMGRITSLSWAIAVRTRTPQRLQICVLSRMQQDATPMNTASACGVGAVNTEKDIHSARRGNTAGELQISGYWIEHGTEQNTEWNGTWKTEVIVKNNRSKPLQMRLQIQRTHWEREIIMENSNLQNHILMKLPYSV